MINAKASHRCPSCGNHVGLEYVRRLQQCERCQRVFYYNSEEPYPFPRRLDMKDSQSDIEADWEREETLLDAYRAASDDYEDRIKQIDSSLDRSAITGRILVLIVAVQLMSAIFLSGQVSLHDFTRLEVVLMLALFIVSLILVFFQFRSSGRLSRERRALRDALRNHYERLMNLQQRFDRRVVGTSAYRRSS